MVDTAVVATNDDSRARAIGKVLDGEGVAWTRTTDVNDTVNECLERLPEVAFIDFTLSGGSIDVVQKVSDYYGLETRMVLFCPQKKVGKAATALDRNRAASVVPFPVEERDVLTSLQNAPPNPGFNAECRVTFINPGGTKEHQTTHGVARPIKTDDRAAVTVPRNQVPDWAGRWCEVVVGNDGELVESFRAEGVKKVDDVHDDIGALSIFFEL